MEGNRTLEYVVPNDGKKVVVLAEEYSSRLNRGELDELLLKVPLKHAARGVSLTEVIKRKCDNLLVENKLTNIFSGKQGVDRRKEALLLIRIKKKSQSTSDTTMPPRQREKIKPEKI